MAQKSFQELHREVVDAIESGRSYLAAPFLVRKWDQLVSLAPSSASRGDLIRLKEKLLFTAFCDLPLAQATGVIEKQLLNFLSEVDINDALKTRLIFSGYGNENEERKRLREAALRNEQVLGGKKVSEWLQAFDKAYPPEESEEATAGKFFAGNSDVANLSKTEQALLKRLLQVYDEWLRAPLMSIFDASEIYKKLDELEKSGVKEINVKTFTRDYFPSSGVPRTSPTDFQRGSIGSTMGARLQVSSVNTVSLPLLQALPKYNNLGNQLITEGRIRVKSQPEPVRPSLLYWLKYYRDELGIGQHSSVERGDFLFRSENGRKLTGEERERISLILKSVEEGLLLSIDPGRQEIIFPNVPVSPHKEPPAQATPPSSMTTTEIPRREPAGPVQQTVLPPMRPNKPTAEIKNNSDNVWASHKEPSFGTTALPVHPSFPVPPSIEHKPSIFSKFFHFIFPSVSPPKPSGRPELPHVKNEMRDDSSSKNKTLGTSAFFSFKSEKKQPASPASEFSEKKNVAEKFQPAPIQQSGLVSDRLSLARSLEIRDELERRHTTVNRSDSFGISGPVRLPVSTPVSPMSPRNDPGELHIKRGTAFVANEAVAQAKNVGFSTGHFFPAEKEAVRSQVATVQKTIPITPPKPIFTPSPVSVSPRTAPVSVQIQPMLPNQNVNLGKQDESASAQLQRDEPVLVPLKNRPIAKVVNPFHIHPVSLGGKDKESSEEDK